MNVAADLLRKSAAAMAESVRAGSVSAGALVQASLARIEATDGRINAFTERTQQRALQRAAALDAQLAAGGENAQALRTLPLLGVPFAVKNLFDIEGIPTLAGSK
ncbi:MAG TPA: amidase family protein, partial [Variovorax sp.]|nr:amidase family protein [Variovorax sp.]